MQAHQYLGNKTTQPECASERVSLVNQNLVGINACLDEIHNQITILEERLRTVLRQEPKRDEVRAPNPASGVELVDRLDETCNNTGRACGRLASILHRLGL